MAQPIARFEYGSENTNQVDKIADICNKWASSGWVLDQFACGGAGVGGGNRWTMIFRRPLSR
jgi:hypothetical protein